MAIYTINLNTGQDGDHYTKEPPVTIPVLYGEDQVALAIFDREWERYAFDLPDLFYRMIGAGELVPTLNFAGPGNPSSVTYRTGFELVSIRLVHPGPGVVTPH